jgi:hypothetical protein
MKLSVTKPLTTSLPQEKVAQLADECGVELAHLDTRFAGKGKWVNDFEITGSPGKVDAFFERFEDIRRD